MTETSSTGLPPRVAAPLAYSAWWLSGLVLWWVERLDPFVRFHAAQAITAFGGAALLIILFAGMAVLSLQLMPRAFVLLMGAAGGTAAGATVLWLAAVVYAARGVRWQIPGVGGLAERLARAGAEGTG